MDQETKSSQRKALEAHEKEHLIDLLLRAKERMVEAEKMARRSFEEGETLGKMRGRAVIAEELDRAGFTSAARFLRGE